VQDTNNNTIFDNKKHTLSLDECNDIHKKLEKIQEELEDIKRKLIQIDTAFLRDDLLGIDYPGHRKEHLERRRADIVISEYKVSATKIALGIIVTFLMGLLASGFITKMAAVVTGGT
jgi:hypothetical protein